MGDNVRCQYLLLNVWEKIFFLFWRTFFSTTSLHAKLFGRVPVHIWVFLGDKCFSSTTNPHTRMFGRVSVHIGVFLGYNSFSSTANPHAQIFRRVSVDIWGFWGDSCFSSSTTNPHEQMFGRVPVNICFFFLETMPSPVMLIPTRKFLGEYLFMFGLFWKTFPSPASMCPILTLGTLFGTNPDGKRVCEVSASSSDWETMKKRQVETTKVIKR